LIYQDKIHQLKGPIFVFGASGFIGANLFKDIFSVRKDVYALTHDATKAWRLKLLDVPFENIVHCDILSNNSVEQIFEQYKPRTIFNLAAYGAYSKQKNINLTYETNVIGTVNILESCTDETVYIHAGSSSEYGFNCTSPRETDPVKPNSHYAVSKVSAAYLIEFYAKVHQRKALNLRLYSIYGAWEEPDRLIPRLVEEARKGKYPPLVSPDISRDFVYADDCVEAFLDAALQVNSAISGKSYNIATGQKTTMRELVADFGSDLRSDSASHLGKYAQPWLGLSRMVRRPVPQLNKILGWQARTSLSRWTAFNEIPRMARKLSQYEADVYCPLFQNPKLNPVITAIIACYKDAQAIPFMYERLVKTFNELKVRYEIIFVNDASPDNQDEVINAICQRDSNVIGITHSRNFGSQSAFLSGMEISTGDAVVLMDGDLQDPPEIIPHFYEKWTNGYDVVYGVRVQREMKPHIHFFYKTFYKVFQNLSYVPIPRDAGDFLDD
jgi:nucleoside-diphosphate-sugar epimerase